MKQILMILAIAISVIACEKDEVTHKPYSVDVEITSATNWMLTVNHSGGDSAIVNMLFKWTNISSSYDSAFNVNYDSFLIHKAGQSLDIMNDRDVFLSLSDYTEGNVLQIEITPHNPSSQFFFIHFAFIDESGFMQKIPVSWSNPVEPNLPEKL